MPDLRSISERLHRAASTKDQGAAPVLDQDQQGRRAPPPSHPDHEHFIRSIRFYEPEEQQDIVLGVGETTPRKAVHQGSGRIVDGGSADKLLDCNRARAEWARRAGSRVDIRMETITEEDAQLVERIRAQEEPLPTVADRWGNAIPVVGYGEGEYYRLSRQPIWVIRQLAPGAATTQDPKGNGKGHGGEESQRRMGQVRPGEHGQLGWMTWRHHFLQDKAPRYF